MKCYVCAREGKESDAIAVCIICGMGLCKEHAIREDLAFWEGQFIRTELVKEGGVTFKLPPKLPRILCEDCYAVMHP